MGKVPASRDYVANCPTNNAPVWSLSVAYRSTVSCVVLQDTLGIIVKGCMWWVFSFCIPYILLHIWVFGFFYRPLRISLKVIVPKVRYLAYPSHVSSLNPYPYFSNWMLQLQASYFCTIIVSLMWPPGCLLLSFISDSFLPFNQWVLKVTFVLLSRRINWLFLIPVISVVIK